MTEYKTISIQNIDFLDVAIDAIDNCFDVTNKISENKILMIDFDWLIDNVNINVDSFDENVANDVKIAIDVIFANSFVVILTNFVIDMKKNVDFDTNIAYDVCFANSFWIVFANFANFLIW